MIIKIKIYEDGKPFVEKDLSEGVYRGGRSEFADINLPSEGISRSHFELRVTASNAYLTNMSIGGRIKVNGKQVETSEINDGDIIDIGDYQILVSFAASPSASEGAGAEPNGFSGPGNSEFPAEDGQGNGLNADSSAASENTSPDVSMQADDLFPGASPNQSESEADRVPKADGQSGLFPFGSAVVADAEGTAALNRAETVVDGKPVVAKLMFVEGPRKGDELFIEAYEISLGRSKKADIFLDDEKLSRIHAKITRVGMGFRLLDIQSRNGTYVNGVRVLEHPLSSFDTIEIGSTKIRFLIHDMVAGDLGRLGSTSLVESSRSQLPSDPTKSLLMSETDQRIYAELQPPPLPPSSSPSSYEKARSRKGPALARGRMLVVGLVAILISLYFLMSTTPTQPKVAVDPKGSEGLATTKPSLTLPSVISKEYLELSPELQRAIQGYYNTSLRAADREMYPEAIQYLKKIHDIIPSYKESVSLMEMYQKRLKEKQAQLANERAKKDDKQELQILIEDGIRYLKEGDWDKAAEAFNYAIQIDLENPIVKKGLKAADLKIRSLDQVPEDRNPLKEKEEQIGGLFRQAMAALEEGRYQDAITMAEDIRKIELPGRTDYLNEAKQILDRAKLKQKEQFEPFLLEAKAKYAEGDFAGSRELCEEMLKKDSSFTEAKECVLKAKKQLNKLAKEAYTLGYVLESMNRIEEAKQYWNRAKNYARPGDDYYDKIMNKLDFYQ